MKRAREELQRTARALRDAERGREAAQDELNQAEAQLAFREVVKRQDDAALAARRRAHGAADVAANALRSLLADAEEAHAKTKAQVHEKISNMKALIHGNCDRERRKWKTVPFVRAVSTLPQLVANHWRTVQGPPAWPSTLPHSLHCRSGVA